MSFPYRDPQFSEYGESLRPLAQSAAVPYGLGTAPHREAMTLGAQPLSVVHIGPCLSRGGAEQQVIDLGRFLNPQRYRLAKCLVLPGGRIDPSVVRDFDCPVEAATPDAIKQATQEHDICLFWGMSVDQFLENDPNRRAACIFLAHGDSWWTQDLVRNSQKSIDHFVAVSEGVRRATCGGVEHSVILNGVDTARLATTQSRRDVRKRLGFQDKDFVIGFVGRFAPEKNVELIIRALALLPRRFKALIVGWGPLKQPLLELSNDLIPNRYAFVSAERYLGDYYQSMDAFSLLSDNEGFALVIIEAMFAGLPIVATKVGAVPEVVEHGINGLTVDGEVREVADAFRKLERHRHWSAGVGREAREYALQHGHASRMARQYEELFDRLLTAKGRSLTGPDRDGTRLALSAPYGLGAPYGLSAESGMSAPYGLETAQACVAPYGLASQQRQAGP